MIRLTGRFSAVGGRARHVTGPRRGGARTLATLTNAVAAVTVAVAALAGAGSALAATTSSSVALSYLFSVPAAAGSLTGPNDQHLRLRLTDTPDYVSRFTDRPLGQAFVVADADFVGRFKRYFANSRPNAVLTYIRPGGRIPVSIGLTIGQPRWDAHHHTWTFPAARIRQQTDDLPGTTIHVKPPPISAPGHFTGGTLLIDATERCGRGVFEPYEDCEAADLAFVDLSGADLTGVNFSDANLTDANLTGTNLTGANFTGADLSGAQLTDSDLTGSDLTGEDLSGGVFIGSDLADVDLTGADLTGADLPGVNLAFANLAGVNLTDADLAIADLTDADLTGADVTGASFVGARVCGAILPQGNIGGGC